MNVLTREERLNLSDSALNEFVPIRGTDYDKNVRYGSLSKKYWKSLYENGMTVSQIAEAYGANYKTVRMVVDSNFAESIKKARVAYNKKYYSTHDSTYDPMYLHSLINRKRAIISSENIAHLKTI